MLCYRLDGQEEKIMITFTKKDNGRQFISIKVDDTLRVKEELQSKYPVLKQANIVLDEVEILIEIEDSIQFGFSLNELRAYINSIAPAHITHFTVDVDEPAQRYIG